ncbi:allantoate amidohydrolase [Nocardioidaceae bacterium]|nr:allantoate amidohydrolase [Nocardioidaceae bacterium]
MTTGAEVLARCAQLDTFSADPVMLVRTHLTPQHAAANTATATWMVEAGMHTWVDAAGNQWGRVEGRQPGLPALVLGSHLDTVIDAGSYDGPLGVLMAVAVVERLRDRLKELPFAIEVVAFSDEEGTRFGSALMGSYAVAGLWDEAWWQLRDADGVGLTEAFERFGLDPARVGEAARRPEDVVGYLEAHIEQGPYLERDDVSLGYVTTIAGARRFTLSVIGEARHAGGTPYDRRRDALVGASHAITLIEQLARASSADDDGGFIATVGRIEVHPGAVNVVPGRADFSLDLRAGTDEVRDAAWDRIVAGIEALCEERGLALESVERYRAAAATCAPWLRDAVVAGIVATGQTEVPGLWSRAGHDAMAMARLTDIGMLFVRCHDGISHHPAEAVREVDVDAGLEALEVAVLTAAAHSVADTVDQPGAHA